jgi:hypothetical protein
VTLCVESPWSQLSAVAGELLPPLGAKPRGNCSSSKVGSCRPPAELLRPWPARAPQLRSPLYALLPQTCTGKGGREKKLCRPRQGSESGRSVVDHAVVREGAAAASSRPAVRWGPRASSAAWRWSRDVMPPRRDAGVTGRLACRAESRRGAVVIPALPAACAPRPHRGSRNVESRATGSQRRPRWRTGRRGRVVLGERAPG